MHQLHTPSTETRKIWKLAGGLHIPDNKSQSNGKPVRPAALPKRLVIPLSQHIGEPTKPLVAVGDQVRKGQLIGEASGFVTAPVHASSSGTVVEISEQPVPHPSGLPALCVVIETDGKEEWASLPAPIADWESAEPEALRQRIRWAGIVGMGGAAFPSSVKLAPKDPIHTLVLNGAECEPFITCDDMLMREKAGRVVIGARIMLKLTGAKNCIIGIEDNKPEAAAAMRAAVKEAGFQAEVVVIPTRYPSGGEKQLIYILTGQEAPSGGIPAQIGFVVHNVGTAAAVADAVLEGKPMIARYVTLTGQGIKEPQNLEVLVGTPIGDLIPQAGGYTGKAMRLIVGGPMMGISLPHDQVPITKAANCVLAPSPAEAPDPGPALPCIRCGQCSMACPMSLLPQQMYWHVRATDLDKAKAYNLFDCIECGCCSHVCPAHIPLVQYYRYGKSEIRTRELEARKADLAKRRNEAKEARLARQEEEKKAKMAAKQAALKKPAGEGAAAAEGAEPDPKAAAIAAAQARAAEKKKAQGGVPKNTDELTPAQQAQVEQAEARRTAAMAEAEAQAATRGATTEKQEG